jgi:anthranilate phosphoribosyltransferase
VPAVSLEDLGGWPAVLGPLLTGEDLTSTQAAAALADVLEGRATPAQLAAFIVALRIKGETVEEMTGLVRAMLDASTAVPLPSGLAPVDTCGTGGSSVRRIAAFNVSTIASFVIAGAGAPVCKHGNRAASSTSGSADLLEALGVAIDCGPAGVARCVVDAGMGFCFAPRFHPAMRHAGPT